MKANIRSISGAVLMLVIIPIIAGLLACMPVPIGDPERSRIDPQMSGWWVMEAEDGDAALSVFRPYDKRTWVVIQVSIEKGDAAEFEEPQITTVGDLLAVLREQKVGSQGIVGVSPAVFKVWLTRLGGQYFATWEPVGEIANQDTFAPEYWWVFKVGAKSDDYFELKMLDPEYAEFSDLVDRLEENTVDDPWKMRKQWERVIRRNIDDPDLYEEGAIRFRRLPDGFAKEAASLVAWPFDY